MRQLITSNQGTVATLTSHSVYPLHTFPLGRTPVRRHLFWPGAFQHPTSATLSITLKEVVQEINAFIFQDSDEIDKLDEQEVKPGNEF